MCGRLVSVAPKASIAPADTVSEPLPTIKLTYLDVYFLRRAAPHLSLLFSRGPQAVAAVLPGW